MIYVVESIAQGTARVWFAFDADDFARKVEAGDARYAHEIHDVVSPRELLENLHRKPDDVAVRKEFPAICALADATGWDALLYRADYIKGRGVYDAVPVEEHQACVAALQARGVCRIYWSDAAAIAAVEGDDALLADQANWRVRHALREQLLALDVLAD